MADLDVDEIRDEWRGERAGGVIDDLCAEVDRLRAKEADAEKALDLQLDVEGLRRENVRLMRVLAAAREVITLEAELGSRAPFVVAWDALEAAVEEADRG